MAPSRRELLVNNSNIDNNNDNYIENYKVLSSINTVIKRVNKKFRKNNRVNTIKSLNCLHMNPTSLVNKWDEFNSLINCSNFPHIILISETWFNQSSLTQLNNYSLYSRNRETVRGGGVAIYIRNDLKSYEVNDSALSNPNCEQIWCHLSVGKDSVLIGCIYRPPFSSRETNVDIIKSINRAKKLKDLKQYNGLIIAGDFNLSDIDWNEDGGIFRNRGRPSSIDFLDCFNSNFLHQHVLEKTFGNNTLDLVLTDDPVRIYETTLGPPLGSTLNNSLHNIVNWQYQLIDGSVTKEHNIKHILSKGNYTDFSNELDGVTDTFDDVNEMYNVFVEKYNLAMNKHVPKRSTVTNHTKTQPKWFNPRLNYLTKLKYSLHCKIRANQGSVVLKVE